MSVQFREPLAERMKVLPNQNQWDRGCAPVAPGGKTAGDLLDFQFHCPRAPRSNSLTIVPCKPRGVRRPRSHFAPIRPEQLAAPLNGMKSGSPGLAMVLEKTESPNTVLYSTRGDSSDDASAGLQDEDMPKSMVQLQSDDPLLVGNVCSSHLAGPSMKSLEDDNDEVRGGERRRNLSMEEEESLAAVQKQEHRRQEVPRSERPLRPSKKPKIVVSLTTSEIEADFLAITGRRLPRMPRRAATRGVFFPGSKFQPL